MKIVEPQVMKDMDRKAVEEYGVPGLILMENAGRNVAEFVVKRYPSRIKRGVAVFCGKGNNGGDGFVAARHLKNMGCDVNLYILSNKEDISGDSLINLNIWQAMGEDVHVVLKESDIEKHRFSMIHSGLVIDAVLGTGLKNGPAGVYAAVIEHINEISLPVVSVDIPSGLDGATGRPLGSTVRADMTVTMALPKTGLVTYPGIKYTGELKIADIGMPARIIDEEDRCLNLVDDAMVRALVRQRRDDAHKGDAGHLLVLAGSRGKTGAAALTSMAALRAGSGLVTLGVPRSVNPTMEEKLTEVMTCPLDETDEASLSFSGIEEIFGLIDKKNAVAIGPGLTTHSDVKKVVAALIEKSPVPLVIDADGINCIAGELDVFKNASSQCILTPHPGEMARLTGTTPSSVQSNRIGIVRGFSVKYGVFLVLKGAGTVVSDPSGTVYINTTGNSGMATAGMGDVLTGIIGGFLTQGYKPLDACIMGVYLHGAAGDMAASEKGKTGLIASDVLDALPLVEKDYLG